MPIGQNSVRRFLVVEDEVLVALNLEDMLVDLGHTVVAVAARVPQALALAESSDFDLAVLDLNLSGTFTFPIADVLRRRGIPFMFATGHGARGLPEEYRNEIILTKPYGILELEFAISCFVEVRTI